MYYYYRYSLLLYKPIIIFKLCKLHLLYNQTIYNSNQNIHLYHQYVLIIIIIHFGNAKK